MTQRQVGAAPSGTTDATTKAYVDYDRSTNVYNLQATQMRRYHAARSKAVKGTGLCRIAVMGESIEAGIPSSFGANAWPIAARDVMGNLGIPLAGTGWVPVYNNTSSGVDPRWSLGTGWSTAAALANPTAFASTSGKIITFTANEPGTIVTVAYMQVSGTFTVSIDGAAAVTVTPTGASAWGYYQVTGLAYATHTAVIATVTGTQFYIAAAECRNASGLVVDNWGYGGTMASDWDVTNWFDYRQLVISTAPSLVIYGWGGNEAINSQLLATQATALANHATAFASFDQVLRIPTPGDGGGFSAAVTLPYRTAIYNLAIANSFPLIDFFDRFGSYTIQNGLGMYANTLHPNDAGYQDMGVAAAALLMK
jgi:lysophospholipase L1-like esterase